MSALTPEVRELLTVIRDGLSLPYAADAENHVKRDELRCGRTICTAAALNVLLALDDTTVEEITRHLRVSLAGYPIDYVIKFKVTVRPWEHGWELHIPDVGVTQSAPNKGDAEAVAHDYIALERDLSPDAFRVFIDTTEVDQ